MKVSEIVAKTAALLLTGSLIVSSAACAKKEEPEETEETTTTTEAEETSIEETEIKVEETSEETTEETTVETTEETTEALLVDINQNNDRQACTDEEDDARYLAFLQNEYPSYAESIELESEDIKIAYVDLDGNGADEMFIGLNNEYGSGVYFVVTEVDGEYNVATINGWVIQVGATTGEYLGNGHFNCRCDSGNDFGHESHIVAVYGYDENLQNCGIIARYSMIFYTDQTVTTQLYTLNDGYTVMIEDPEDYTDDNTDYTYETITCDLHSSEDDGLRDTYDQIEESYMGCEDPYSVLSWRPISDITG